MEFLQANWVWLLLVVGALWLLSRGGLGCGMGRRDDRARDGREGESRESGLRSRDMREREPGEVERAGHRGHRGC